MNRVFHISTFSTKKEEKNQKKKEITTTNSNLNLAYICVDKRDQLQRPDEVFFEDDQILEEAS
jgi:hypothetical protein